MADYTPNSRTIKLEGFAEFEQQLREMAQMYRADTVARQTLVKAANDAMMPVLYAAGMDAPYDPLS